jgi:RHH-type proline utilization regulon transcriptional repressor/proline dehydrogenase/delta 1-pyrroline-5-carboxylate dehydrogenase
MIGAVVGVQPFGGRGLSGTGPKAGGPDYVKRLMKEITSEDDQQTTRAIPAEVSFDESAQALEAVNTLLAEDILFWRNLPLDKRLTTIRQWLAKLASVQLLQDFANDLEATLHSARHQLLGVETYMGEPHVLPGPTGESNILYHEPRGTVLCYADKDTSFNFWVLSIVTALATGNRVITVVSEMFYQEALALTNELDPGFRTILQVAPLEQLKLLLAADEISAVVVGKGCQRKSFINHELAARDGKLVPLISCEYEGNLIERLVMEKTVSIDTTASGGNTLLMTLGDVV